MLKQAKSIVSLVVCFSVVFLLVAAGCGGLGEKAIEKAMDKLMETETEAVETEANIRDGARPVRRPLFGGSNWPAWVPSAIPVYRYGDIMHEYDEDDEGALVFMNIQMDNEPYESYKKELADKGWVAYEEMEMDQVKYLHMEQGEYWLVYTFPNDGDGVSIYFGGSGGELGQVQDGSPFSLEKQESKTITATDGEHTFTTGDKEIPDGFPLDTCPIYQPSEVMVVNTMAGGDLELYIVMLLTRDDQEKVMDFYRGKGFETIFGPGLMYFEKGNVTGSIQISPAEAEYASQGYKTMFAITADVKK